LSRFTRGECFIDEKGLLERLVDKGLAQLHVNSSKLSLSIDFPQVDTKDQHWMIVPAGQRETEEQIEQSFPRLNIIYHLSGMCEILPTLRLFFLFVRRDGTSV
jgi:hypothetical protein